MTMLGDDDAAAAAAAAAATAPILAHGTRNFETYVAGYRVRPKRKSESFDDVKGACVLVFSQGSEGVGGAKEVAADAAAAAAAAPSGVAATSAGLEGEGCVLR